MATMAKMAPMAPVGELLDAAKNGNMEQAVALLSKELVILQNVHTRGCT